MTLSPEHEGIAGFFPALILILADECGMEYLSRRSTTMRKRKKSRGLEPDDCFYFRNFKRISGKKVLDLSVDPPPDLAIEVDVPSGSMNKFPIYAAIGVPELWRHDGERVQFHCLAEVHCVAIQHSDLFPFLTPEVSKFLRKAEAEGDGGHGEGFPDLGANAQASREPQDKGILIPLLIALNSGQT